MSFYLSLHMYMTTERGLERNVSLEDWEFDSRPFNTRRPKEKLLRKCAQHSKFGNARIVWLYSRYHM